MDIQRKSIQGLTISLDQKREDLTVLYRKFGTALLSDAENPTIPSGIVDEERISTYRSLMASRESDSKTILDIQDALIRKQQLKQFGRELDISFEDEQQSYEVLLEDLGKAFFTTLTNNESSFETNTNQWGSFLEKAQAEKSTVTKIEEKKLAIEKETVTAGFFGKMIAQVKSSTISPALKQAQTRLRSIFVDEAKNLLLQKSLLKREDVSFPLDFSEIFEKVSNEASRLEKIKERKDSLLSDIDAVNATLKEYDALDNSQRKIKELHARIKDTDKRIDSLLLLTSREYSDRFIDDSGSYLQHEYNEQDSHSFGNYRTFLDEISACRKEINDIRSNIEIIEAKIRVQTLEKNIESFNNSISDCESRISHYQNTISTMKSSIIESEQEKMTLIQKIEDLQAHIKTV